MMAANNTKEGVPVDTTALVPRLRPVRALLNGLVAYVLGTLVISLPAIFIALSIGFELGPQGADQVEISRTISSRIAEFYRGNILVQFGGSLIIALLVYRRTRVCARGTGMRAIRTGLLVALLPVVVDIVFAALTVGDVAEFLLPLMYVLAGYVGGSAERARV
jgi:hypothetical protein